MDFDLSAALAKLPSSGSKYKLVRDISRSYHAIRSAMVDLETAHKSLVLLLDRFAPMKDITGQAQSEEDAILGGGLFYRAIVLYARALQPDSRSVRPPSGLRKLVPAHMVKVHETAVRLRNDAIAHFGQGDYDWARETVTLVLEDETAWVNIAYSRFNYVANLSRDLIVLIEAILEHAHPEAEARGSRLLKELRTLFEQDQHFVAALSKTPFNFEGFYGRSPPPDYAGLNSIEAGNRSSLSDLHRPRLLDEP